MPDVFVKPGLAADGSLLIVPVRPGMLLRRVPGEAWPRGAVPPRGCRVDDIPFIRRRIARGDLIEVDKAAVVADPPAAAGADVESSGGRSTRGRRKSAGEE